MVGSTRIDLASNRLEGSAFAAGYPNGQRSTYSSPSLERSASFRDSLESRLMVSGSIAYRNASHSSEIPPPSQFLSLEPFSIAELNLKYSRQGELRRALALSVEDHSVGSVHSKNLPPVASEELKRFRVSVLDTCIRARERSKLMQEAILKLDKYRGIVTRRRQRNEAQSVEKPGSSNMSKTSNLIHQNSLDATIARTEERSKSAIPNKRVRSSIVESRFEGRSTISARQGAVMDKDKNILLEKEKLMLRACNGGPISSEERSHALHAGGDGWEKKLKRKRSVSTMVTRTLDDREFKQTMTMQQKPTSETRTRASDGLGFRSGPSNGTTGSSRIENSSQISGNSCRAMPRNETENISLSSERRERVAGLDKEKIMAKGSSKLNNREECQLGGQSPLVKGKASRASRNGVGSLTSASNLLHLSGGMEGWEHCLNKGQQFSALANCKRPLTTGSLSPPVAQWVGQRPQKISRTRRANVVSPVSNFDDVQVFPEALSVPDVGARLSSVDSGGSLNSRVVSNGPYQLKIRLDNVPSPAGLSESEESGVIENKRVKGLDNDEADNCFPPKLFASPTKKNKIPPKEEVGGDGVRRHGRSGRISANLKTTLVTTKEKPENADTSKQFKSSRPASDKGESRVGRPPSKKLSDHKACGRPVQSIRGGSLDLIGETDDDHEDLMTAAIAARNFSYNACSSSFWKKMEIVFAFISPEDLSFVKNQIKFAEEIDYSLCSILEPEHYVKGEASSGAAPSLYSSSSSSIEHLNGSKSLEVNSFIEAIYSADERQPAKLLPTKADTESWPHDIFPLSQRLLSALIMEDGTESLDCSVEQKELLSQISSDCSTYGPNCHLDSEQDSADIKPDFELNPEYRRLKNFPADVNSCNGFSSDTNIATSVNQASLCCGDLFQENVFPECRVTAAMLELENCNLEREQCSGTGMLSTSPFDGQFESLPLSDRILMELHSIGIYPDLVPGLAEGEDEEIDSVISRLRINLFKQVRNRRRVLYELEKALQGVKEIQERDLEQLAMHKLLETAYKRLGGRGSHGSSHKVGVSKISKHLALLFAKRTLVRCQKLEETGHSCFSEPPTRDELFLVLQHSTDKRYFTGLAANNSERYGHKSERHQFDPFQAASNLPEQQFVKSYQFSNTGKKKEVLLDDVVISAAARTASISGSMIPIGPKWKKIDKEKDHTLVKSLGAKAGRQSLSYGRGERKPKTKPKQKIAQLSNFGNGLDRLSEANFLTSAQESLDTINSGGTRVNKTESLVNREASDLPKEMEDNIFTNLPMNGMAIDELDVADDLGGQGQDIGSWLNVDEDALQDHDLVGLEIPMDDLSELKLNF